MRRAAMVAVLATALLAACGDNKPAGAYKQIEKRANGRSPYIPKNDVEFKNYNRAQQLYDSPTTIIWCSTTWGNPSSPIVTVPIAGKLTSSSTTFFAPEYRESGSDVRRAVAARSVDGLYHPNPPQYRYGFTPGGQYVDFFNMPTVCTTALTKFQRQQTKLTVEVDAQGVAATKRAEAALRRGDAAAAQRDLEGLGR
jgi:hypothetical protein